MRVGRFFDAQDFIPVSQAHMMADTESLGESGVAFIEQFARVPKSERRVRVPTITDPRGIDFDHYRTIKQTDAMAAPICFKASEPGGLSIPSITGTAQ